MPDWEEIFKDEGKVFEKPVEQMPEAISELQKIGAKRVLDLGCGTGRHSVELAKAGFELYSADASPEALRQTRAWLESQGLTASYHHFSCYERFPFQEDTFDGIISTQVIHHNYIKNIRFCISEMERVLRPGGFLFVSVSARKSHRHRSAPKLVEPRTYLPTGGRERGVPHYIYNMELLRKDFSNFKISMLEKTGGIYYNLFANLKGS